MNGMTNQMMAPKDESSAPGAFNPQGQLDPAMIKQVLAMQDNANDPNAQVLARKQAMVNQMRQSAMEPEEGKMAGNSRNALYVAPSPLSHLVKIGQGAMAGYTQNQVDKGQQGLSDSRLAGREKYFEALTKGLRGAGPGPGRTAVGATPSNSMAGGESSMIGVSTPQAGY